MAKQSGSEQPGYLCDFAELDWDDGTPRSGTYGDIYWNKGSPIAEKKHVFVSPFERHIGELPSHSQVTIGELGFGFGINCLLTADLWQKMPKDRMLNYVSIEKHPIKPGALAKCIGEYNFAFADELNAQYPPPYRGQHVIWLAQNIRLLLVFDDVNPALANLDAQVDFWYLDGFAPSKNEEMWQGDLFRKLYSRSRAGTRITSYSVAGSVRRGLDQAGFQILKVPGFGQKKEMLTATRPGTWSARTHGTQSVAIIGAGIAGQYCAEALERRNIESQLIDRGLPGPSHIPQLSVLPQLAATAETKYRLSLNASQYMRHSAAFHPSGLLWRGKDEQECERLKAISAHFPDDLIEAISEFDFQYHQAGWLNFHELCTTLSIKTTDAHVDRIVYSGQWQCLGRQAAHTDEKESLVATADHLIIATGYSTTLLPPQLTVSGIRGQAMSVATQGIDQIINSSVTIFPTAPLSEHLPEQQGRSVISGTYARTDDLTFNPDDAAHLLAEARKHIKIDDSTAEHYMGIRAIARDRLPVIGPAPDWHALEQVNRLSAVTSLQPGLHFCSAFGSRGATHARLCAEHVVSKLLGEPAALGLAEQHLLSPARFMVRDQTRGLS